MAPNWSWEQAPEAPPAAPDPVLTALNNLTEALLQRPEPPAPVVQEPVTAPDLSGLAASIGAAVEAAVGRALRGLPTPAGPDFSEVSQAIRDMSKRAIQAAASGGGGSTGGPFPLVVSAGGVGTSGNALVVTSGDRKRNDGTLYVADDYATGEPLAEVAGTGAAQTLTFSSPIDFVWVTDVSTVTTNISHVDAFGGTPTAAKGYPVFNQAPAPISVIPASATVQLFAPVGATINAVGYRRA